MSFKLVSYEVYTNLIIIIKYIKHLNTLNIHIKMGREIKINKKKDKYWTIQFRLDCGKTKKYKLDLKKKKHDF